MSGVKLVFISDTQSSLNVVVDLVNTLPETDSDGRDSLATPEDYDAFLAAHPFTGLITRDERERAGVRGIRRRLLELWDTDRDGAVPLVNAMLHDGHARPQLVRHDEDDWHIHAADAEAPLATRILVEGAMAFVEVIRADQYDRVRRCSADDCESVYVDYSRNGSKLYCDTGNCGNRMNVIAYRRRRSEAEATG